MSDPIEGGAYSVPRRSGIDCSEAGDLIPALALGAIEPAERLLLQAHCEICVDCSSELKASNLAASMLAYSVPLFDPPARAKTALFERIAPTTVSVVAAEPAAELFGSPLVASPGEKRRRKSSEHSQTVEDRFAPGSVTSPINRWTGRVSKLAAAPLALALVLVSVYAMQTRGDVQDLQALNASLAASINTADTAAASTDDPTLAAAPTLELTVTSDSSSDMIAQPVSYTFSSTGSGGQTGSTRAVSPGDSTGSTCRMAGDGTGKYHLQISGVKLASRSDVAAVYLQTASGEPIFLTNVSISSSGNGEASFNFDQPIADDSTLLIGLPSSGSAGAQPLNNAVTYLLTNDDSDVTGLGASS